MRGSRDHLITHTNTTINYALGKKCLLRGDGSFQLGYIIHLISLYVHIMLTTYFRYFKEENRNFKIQNGIIKNVSNLYHSVKFLLKKQTLKGSALMDIY